MTPEVVKCELCGEPMPAGEDMFKFHGYSGPCPKPPLPRKEPNLETARQFACGELPVPYLNMPEFIEQCARIAQLYLERYGGHHD